MKQTTPSHSTVIIDKDSLSDAAQSLADTVDAFMEAGERGEYVVLKSKFPVGDSLVWTLKDKVRAVRDSITQATASASALAQQDTAESSLQRGPPSLGAETELDVVCKELARLVEIAAPIVKAYRGLLQHKDNRAHYERITLRMDAALSSYNQLKGSGQG